MTKKILYSVILIVIILSSMIIPNIYAANLVTISRTEVFPGETLTVCINIKDIDVSKITLKTSVYLYPTLDKSGVSGIESSEFDAENQILTIESESGNSISGVDTLYVTYKIPEYKNGTNITLSCSINEGEPETFKITVKSNEEDSQNNSNNMNNANVGNQSTGTTANISSTSMMMGSSTETATYNGSRNNYLSSLSVSGYDLSPEFRKTNNTYFITVANDVTSISVNASKEDSTATLSISGNTNLKVGLNKVLISVLAKNGDVRYYRIYVTREG